MSSPNIFEFDLSEMVIQLDRNCRVVAGPRPPGPPLRIDGYTIGAPLLETEPPHRGEMHPDGDEILLLLSGAITVEIEDEEPHRMVSLRPGQAVVVPKGVWHRVHLGEASRLINITPGPRAEHRPLQ